MFTIRQILNATKGKLISGTFNSRVSGISIDSRRIKPDDLFIAIIGKHFNGHCFIQHAIDKGAGAVIVNQHRKEKVCYKMKKAVSFIQVKDTIVSLGDIAQSYRRRFNIPIIAVTGSNGKTTTKEMIAGILSNKFRVLKNDKTINNLIGVPLCLLKLKQFHQIGVLELGMNQFGEIARLAQIVQPSCGLVTNINPSHLYGLKNLDNVMKAKGELLRNLDNKAQVFLNKDDKYFNALCRYASGTKLFSFGVNSKSSFKITQQSFDNHRLHFIVNDKYPFLINIPGSHNAYNALAAIAVCSQFNMNYGTIMRSLASFGSLSLRTEVKKVDRVTVIDDSYNSNPKSLISAIELLGQYKTQGRKIIVIGDMLELGKEEIKYHANIGKIIAKSKTDILITLGSLASIIAQSAIKAGMKRCSVFNCRDKGGVLEILLNIVKAKDVVLVKGSRLMKMEELTRCFTISYTL